MAHKYSLTLYGVYLFSSLIGVIKTLIFFLIFHSQNSFPLFLYFKKIISIGVFKKKSILLSSIIGCILCNAILSIIYYNLKQNKMIIIFLSIYMIYLIIYSIGLGIIPWIMINDIIPKDNIRKYKKYVHLFYWSLKFFSTLFFLPIFLNYGGIVFIFSTIFLIFGFIFIKLSF